MVTDYIKAEIRQILLIDLNKNSHRWQVADLTVLHRAKLVIYSKNRVTIEESKSAIMKEGRMLESLGQTNPNNKRVPESLSPYVDMVLGRDG